MRRSPCPICGAASHPATRPFCSARCRGADLARWLSGAYAIPGGSSDVDEDGDDARLVPAQKYRSGHDEDD